MILKTVYGFEIKTIDDPYIHIAEEGAKAADGLLPGRFLVDGIPIMKHLPDWLPGTGFKRVAKLWGKQMMDSCRIPFEDINKSFVCHLQKEFTANFLYFYQSWKALLPLLLRRLGYQKSVTSLKKKKERNYCIQSKLLLGLRI